MIGCNIILCIHCIRKGGEMVRLNVLLELMECFPNSVITKRYEFIAHTKANEYFNIKDCESKIDVKCKVLEWFSRGAYKTEPFYTKKENEGFHAFMLAGINRYLQTHFTPEDMCEIYTYLGNGINRNKTIRFIKSGYDMAILREGKQ